MAYFGDPISPGSIGKSALLSVLTAGAMGGMSAPPGVSIWTGRGAQVNPGQLTMVEFGGRTINQSADDASNDAALWSQKAFDKKFGGDEEVAHFSKHGKEIMNKIGESSYNLKNYMTDANFIIKNGTFVPEMNGYVRFFGGKSSDFGFVGLNRATGNITTYHIKPLSFLIKKAPNTFSR
ncbi:hypothetical protein [Pedobacter gandavensis]|uniref:hypothetical protein n=1 Tax=Pedobacter gandavensis TaxID=2679963 RepID=UPI002931597A|nr:hypothetical protein [Pedobacter gandavensis]